jgi:hypothetical protein
MSGFLNSSERVIDLVLTDTGKQLLLRGALQFIYWVPFDDEVNYTPAVTIWNSGSYTTPSQLDELAALITSTSQSMVEDPVIREASAGYRGLNAREIDNTNVFRPMYTARPGVGHMSPLPQIVLSQTGSIDVQVEQTFLSKRQVKKDSSGNVLEAMLSDVGYQRRAGTSVQIDVGYNTGSFIIDKGYEGFLVTVYQEVSGTLQEVVHNMSSDGSIAYRNDLALSVVPK